MRTRMLWSGAVAAGLVVWGCVANKDGSTGSIRGRILGANGQPGAYVRVMLDKSAGAAALTTATGEFQIGHAPAGSHQLLVFDAAAQTGASVAVRVSGNAVTDVGDVSTVPCGVLAAGGGSAPGPSTGNGGGSTGGGPSPTPAPPCGGNPPPDPPNLIHYDQITASEASGFVDQTGIYGFGEDDSQGVGFSFFVPGQLGTNGSVTVHVNSASAGPAIQGTMSLFVWDTTNGWGWLYRLTSGDLTVAVSDDDTSPTPVTSPLPPPPGGPTAGGPIPWGGEVLHFDFKGANLVFDYIDWDNGAVDLNHVATVGLATASGDAWEFLPPPQPTGDITIASFVPTVEHLFECGGCTAGGTAGGPPVPTSELLFIYAYDSNAQADLSLTLPVSDLNLPGSELIDEANAWGEAIYYGGPDHAQWSYFLSSAMLASVSTAVTVGQPLDLKLSNGVFDYVGADGGCGSTTAQPCPVVGANGGGSTGPTPTPTPVGTPVPVTQYHLYIGSGDLSSTVESCAVSNPPPPGPTPIGSPVPGGTPVVGGGATNRM